MTYEAFRSALWTIVMSNFLAMAHGQSVVEYHSVKTEVEVRNILAAGIDLFAWTVAGVTKLSDGKAAAETYLSLATSANGRVFAVNYRFSSIHVMSLFSDSKAEILDYEFSNLRSSVLVSNEDGSFIWCMLFSPDNARLLMIDTVKKTLIKNVELSMEFRDNANVFAASGDSLIVASPAINGAQVTYQLKKLDDSGVLGESLFSFPNTILLRLESSEDGSVVACGRNELHQPDIGFVCCLEAKTLQPRWINRKIIPYCVTLNQGKILLCEGDNKLHSIDLVSGKQLGSFVLGDQPLVRLASSGNFISGLCADAHTVVRTDLSKALMLMQKR